MVCQAKSSRPFFFSNFFGYTADSSIFFRSSRQSRSAYSPSSRIWKQNVSSSKSFASFCQVIQDGVVIALNRGLSFELQNWHLWLHSWSDWSNTEPRAQGFVWDCTFPFYTYHTPIQL